MHYTITVTNTGQTAYTGASFTDPLAGVLDDAAYNDDAAATAGTVSVRQPEPDLDREPGGRRGRDRHVLGDGRAIPTRATAAWPARSPPPPTGNNCPVSGGTDPACTVTVTVVKRDHADVHRDGGHGWPTAGGVVHYTITVANSGLTPYNGATFTAGLGGVLDDATYNNDAAATARAPSDVHQPHPDLDRERARQRDRDHHLFGHREQPRHREPHPDQHHHLHLGRQQLRRRLHRPALHRHGGRSRAGHHRHRRRGHHQPRLRRALHGHRHQHRPGHLLGHQHHLGLRRRTSRTPLTTATWPRPRAPSPSTRPPGPGPGPVTWPPAPPSPSPTRSPSSRPTPTTTGP